MDLLGLPALDGHYPLSPDAVEAFRRDGHVRLEGLATPSEVAAYREVIAAAVEANRQDRRPLAERDTYGKAFIQVSNLWTGDQRVARFVQAKRFAGVAAELLGCTRLRLYEDQALFKEAGGGMTPWHQDGVYWPFERGTKTVTMWMPLVDVGPDMGGMAFAIGSHERGALSGLVISDRSQEHFEALVARGDYPVAQPSPLRAGDATFHAGWTLHRASPNRTGGSRDVMTVIYFADGARLGRRLSPSQEGDLRLIFPGAGPGERAVSELTPLVWP